MTAGFSTPRICFLGNSHLAALRLAAGEEPDLLPGQGRGTDWFASSAYTLGGLRLRKGRYLVPYGKRLKAQFVAIAEGKQQIDIRAYDVFVIAGVGLEYRDIFALSKGHCLAAEAEAGNQAGRALVSEGFFRSYLAGVEAQRPARRLAQEIRSVQSGAQVLFLTAPCPSETILRHQSRSKALSRLPLDSAHFAALSTLHLAVAGRVAAAAGATLLPQDAATLAAPGFTREIYNSQAVGLQDTRSARVGDWYAEKTTYDPWHMNPAFGRQRLLDLGRAAGLTGQAVSMATV